MRANVKSVHNKKLGAWTSFRYQWNQRFHEAYAFIVTRDGEKIAQKFGVSENALEAALRNVEDLYLGEYSRAVTPHENIHHGLWLCRKAPTY